MKRLISFLLAVVLVAWSAAVASAVVYGSDGYLLEGYDEDSAWEINSVATLIKARDDINDGTISMGRYYKLTADLDLSGYKDWKPIGVNSSYPFRGQLDGNGHTITIAIARSDENYAGLFGYIKGGVVKDLSVTGSIRLATLNKSITIYAGGISAYMESGTIDSCKFDGKVNLSGAFRDYSQYAGGIVGYAETSSTLTNNSVGRKDATTNVKALYSISDNPYTYAGGIAGYISNTWNNETTVTGNYSRFKAQAGHTDTLTYGARYSSSYGTFNSNKEDEPEDVPVVETSSIVYGADGYLLEGYDEGSAWVIDSVATLIKARDDINDGTISMGRYYKLTADLDLSGYKDWKPIGVNSSYPFRGELDGNGHTITIAIARSDENYAGLFGYIKGGRVRNLSVTGTIRLATLNKSITIYAGGISAYMESGTIDSCKFDGKVNLSGAFRDYSQYAGGIVGYAETSSTLTNNSVGRKDATTNVKALYSISDNPYTYAGGIAGYISNTWNNETTVTGNYSRLKTQAGHTDTLTYGARYSSSYGTFNNNREFDPDDYPDPEPTPSAVIPTITTSSLPDTTKGTAYTATLTASGTTPITWSLYAGSLPTGLTLSETGTISGTPSAAGTYTFTVKASNSGGEVLKSYTIIVEEVEEEIYPEILTESLPDAKVGKEYSVQVRATVTDGMTWESHGDMPAGLSINASTGFISGTPIKAGVYALDIWLVKEEVIYGSTVRRYENREYTLTVTEDESSRVYGEEGYEEHGGSEDDAWEINSVEVLIKVRDDTNSGTLQAGKYFRLTADLDLTSYTDWEPVGKLEGYHGFGCHFDGDGHTITVDISRTAKETGKEYLAGVFGYVRNAEIKNLSVTGNVILDVSASTVNFHYAGGIAAYALSGVTIDNCKFDGKVSMTGADYLNAGGIVGNAYSSVLTNNTVGGRDTSTVVETLPVTQVGWAGGIVGFVSSNCTVTGNYSRLSTQGKYTKTLTCGRGKEDGTFANNIEIDTSGSESSATAPKITSSINLGTFNTGDSVSIQLKADGTKPITWMVSGGTLPDGLTLSSAGLISGKISVSESFTFTITASNTAGRDSGTFLISVENPSSVTHRYQLISSSMTWTAAKAYCESLGGHLATITSQAEYDEVLKLLPENERRIYWIGAYRDSTDSTEWKWVTGEDFTFTAWQDGEPNNARGNECYMELTNYQGNYNGQWGWNDENDSNLYSYVTGLLCEWDEEEQTVTAPEITTYTLPDGTVGTEYSAQLNAKGTTPITWTAYGLPDGLSMNSDGLISGTPTMLGSYVPSITAGNSAGNDSRVYKIVIAEPKSTATAPVITTGSNLGTHTVGLSVSIQLSATGTTPITWMKTDGNLPGGLTLDEDGLLSGTLTDAGTYSFLISATNTAGSVSRRFSLTAVTITPSVTAPTITTSPDLGKIEAGGSVSVKLKATGTTPITWSAEGLPDGLSISSAGLIYGTVTTAWEYSFAVTAENSAGSDMRTFTLKVEDAAVAPSITTAQDLGTFEYEDSISVQIEATGTDPITWTATGLPTWLEIDADSGAISGTAPKRTGDYSFTVTARNSKGTDSRKFTLKVKSTASVVTAPTITTAALHDGETGVIYTAMLEATGTDPITWNVAGLPEGFTPNVSSGKLSGVPKTGGTFTLTVTATNSAGHDTKEYTLTIAEKIKVSPPKITTGNLPEATEGQPYTFKFEAEGEKLTWSATSKTMTWFTFTNDGVFSGTPDAAGTYNLTVKVRNTAGADYANFTLKVKSSGGNLKVPEVKTTRLPDACKDEEYRCFLEGEGENLTWALAADKGDGLPRGLTLDEDGLISGLVRESTVGTFRFRVTATNSAGTSPVKTVSIKVTGKAPEFTTETLKAAKWNKKYSFALKVRNMKPTAWSIEGELPEGIKFDKGKFTGKATEVDEYNLTITASNGAVTLTDDFTLTVQGVTPKIKGSFKKGTEGQPYTSVLKAKGVTPITWDFEDLPAGLDYTTDATGEVCTISGVPEKAFSDKIKVTIETGDEQTYGKNLKMTIKAVKPKITVDTDIPDAVVDERFRYQLKMTPENAEVVWSYTGDMPYGLTLDEDTGLIYGMPLDEVEKMKVYTFVVTAENASKRSSKSRVTISLRVYPSGTVLPVNTADPSEDSKPEFVNGVAYYERGEMTTEMLATVANSDEVVAAILPAVEVEEAGMYEFTVSLDVAVPEGGLLVWHSFPDGNDDPDDADNAIFLDEDGGTVERVPESYSVTVSAWLEPGVIYEPVIAVRIRD